MYKHILVTGCGGDIGSGIGRILKEVFPQATVIGCDMSADHPGTLIFNRCEVIERADSPTFFKRLRQVVTKHDIDLIIPIPDAEIAKFLEKGATESIDDIAVILANAKALSVGLDKMNTVKFLESGGIPHPWTVPVEQEPMAIPCVLKDRVGHGSRNFCIVEKDLVDYYQKTHPDAIWQELLLPDNEEYTCGLYRTKDDDIRTIIFRRKLVGSMTGSGEVVENPHIKEMLVKVANGLQLRGSINVQLRLTEDGPRIFEINPRFSSTVVFRHRLGFRDVLWSIRERNGENAGPYFPPQTGIRIYRGSYEYIL